MPRTSKNSRLALAFAASLAALTTFAASDAAAQDWAGQVTLYGWGAGVSGDLTPFSGAPSLSFEKSLSEVLKDLDAAFFATALARRGDLVLFGDLTYSAASQSGTVPPGLAASGKVTMRSLTLAGGRRFEAGAATSVDLLAGLRAWKIDGSVNVVPVLSVSPSKSFVDPILAIRVNSQISDRWSVLSYADIGGFGVGSDFTWQAAVTANYRARDNLYLSAGWRHLEVDYSDGGTVFDGSMTGPLVGVTFQF